MAVSHSFAGEHVEDGGGEKTDADCDHHEIEHVITSAGVLQTLKIFTPRFAMNAEPGGFDAD
jgi:hypothetical protein